MVQNIIPLHERAYYADRALYQIQHISERIQGLVDTIAKDHSPEDFGLDENYSFEDQLKSYVSDLRKLTEHYYDGKHKKWVRKFIDAAYQPEDSIHI